VLLTLVPVDGEYGSAHDDVVNDSESKTWANGATRTATAPGQPNRRDGAIYSTTGPSITSSIGVEEDGEGPHGYSPAALEVFSGPR